jgi:hypothetical protein
MDNPDSDDYELMPSHELDDLRREVSSLKKNTMVEGDKTRILIESMDRLTISINRLITILNDAQKDIIDEYQEAKPAEKLNQLFEQNETIARALISMSENLDRSKNPLPIPSSSSPNFSQSSSTPSYNAMPAMPPQNQGQGNPRGMLPPMNPSPSNPQFMNQSQYNASMSMNNSMPPLDDFPTMDDIPPLDNPAPSAPKKKFLGIM